MDTANRMHMKTKKTLVVFLLFLMLSGTASVLAGEEDAYFDYGVFALENNDYPTAITSFEQALADMPENPVYHRYLGKAFLETGEYASARRHLEKAYELDPLTYGLLYDLGFLYFRTKDYEKAKTYFMKALENDKTHVRSWYYAGVSMYRLHEYEKALPCLMEAQKLSPSIRENVYYYAGICHLKTGNSEKAKEMLGYVRRNSGSEVLSGNAEKIITAIDIQKQKETPYHLYAEAGIRYDDNVRLFDPIVADDVSEKSDWAMVFSGYGSYDFALAGRQVIGVNLQHYEVLYQDMDEYDMSATAGEIYGIYRRSPLSFRLGYSPVCYRTDSSSYMFRHRISPKINAWLKENLSFHLVYNYLDDDYETDKDKSGTSHRMEAGMKTYFHKSDGMIFANIDYMVKDAEADAESFDRIQGEIGVEYRLENKLGMQLSGGYFTRTYDAPASFLALSREDDIHFLSVSLSSPLFTDHLGILLEYEYTKADSNYNIYDYSSSVVTFYMTVSL